jgi:tRNA-2-methylthio-N6-dimethylallyladenosine synthase
VEGPSKKANKDPEAVAVQMTGRTHCDRIVVFDGNRRQAGHVLDVHVDDASSHTLIGRVRQVELVSIGV